MKYEVMRHECFLCGRDLKEAMVLWDKQSKPVKDIRSRVIMDGETMIHGKTVLCECGLAQEFEPMTEEKLGEFYAEVDGISPYREIYPCPKQAVILHAKNTIKTIQEHVLPKIYNLSTLATVLLVGAGDLNQVEMYKDCFPGTNVFTYEPGLPESNINYQIRPNKQFDLIVCNNTLEHVHNPITFLKEIKELCHQETQFVINVPDLLTLAITMPKDQWFSNAHIYHFTWETFVTTLRKAGFTPVTGINITEEMGNKLYAIVKRGAVDESVHTPVPTQKGIVDFINYSEELYNLQIKLNYFNI